MERTYLWTGLDLRTETTSRIKKADQEFAPRTRPPGRSEHWPTLVMEAGFSESKSKLASDANWWLTASQGDVRTALTISLHRKKPEIVIEKWEPTSTQAQYEGACRQHLVISEQAGEAVVSNGTLILSCEALFLRDARRGEEEIEFADNEIRIMAQMIWEKQKF